MNAQILREISEKLDTAVELLTEIHTALTDDDQEVMTLEDSASTDPYPWLTKILEFEGKDEVDDNAELSKFLGVDPEDTPWCAAMVTKCLEVSGKPALALRAREYATYGEKGDGSPGDIAVWRSHVGFVTYDSQIIGGNVTNEVKRSPHPDSGKDWFKNFIGFRRVV